MDFWKYIGLGLAAAVTFGAVGYAMQKKDFGADYIDEAIAGAQAEISAGAGISDFFKPNQPPVASLKIDTPNPISGEKIVFNASGSYDPDGDAIRYNWQIVSEDGYEVYAKKTATPVLEESFSNARKYIVMLEAVDNKGDAGAAQMSVEVKEKPRPFDYYDKKFKVGIMIEKYKEYPLFANNYTV